MRRKEDDENTEDKNYNKVSKKGVVMTCTICGTKGHNRRFHGKNAQTDQPHSLK